MLAELLPKPPGTELAPPSVLRTLVNAALEICALYVPIML
jgi:hypothetical protein